MIIRIVNNKCQWPLDNKEMEVKLPKGFFIFFFLFFLTDITVKITLHSIKSCKSHLASPLLSRLNGATLDLLFILVLMRPSDGSRSVIELLCLCAYRRDTLYARRLASNFPEIFAATSARPTDSSHPAERRCLIVSNPSRYQRPG